MILFYYTVNRRADTIEQHSSDINLNNNTIDRLRERTAEALKGLKIKRKTKVFIKKVNTLTGEREVICEC